MKEEIIKLLKQTKRNGISELITFLEESDYFVAPASTRFHASEKHGLMKHSMNVYELFKEKNIRFNLGLRKYTIVLCSFLHDLCKVNVYSEKVNKDGTPSKIPYVFSEDLPLGHSVKSIFVINRFIKLTEEEALIIRWHMSWSDYEFKKHIDSAKKISPAIMAFITSDIEASTYLE